jgi:hypothetical protein
LWTVDYGNDLRLYRVNPSNGATLFSCSIPSANPESAALPGLNLPDGLHWTGIPGAELVISGEIAEAGRPTAVAFVNATNCAISSFFTLPQPTFAQECCSGVAFDGQTLWHATDGLKTVFRTTLSGAPTGLAFSVPEVVGFEDLEFDAVTFAPKCAIWGTTAGTPTVAAYEIPCGGALVANNDAYSTNEDVPLSIPTEGGVLTNDTGGDGQVTAELVATAEHGSVTLNANGSFTYVPSPNFNGVDTFYYVAKAGDKESNIAIVTITVNPVNDPPFFDTIADQFVSPPVSAPQTVHITGISPGPPDEAQAEQSVTLSATSSNALVSITDPITTDGSVGTLTYRRTSSSTGTARITVMAQDSGGGTNTFTRTFDIVVGASGTVEANLTGFSPNADPNKAPTVQVTVTARPIDWNGNGVIDVPGDCYRIFHPQTGRYNIVPSGADRSPEGPPWRVPTRQAGVITEPGDTEEICDIARNFTADVDLGEWIIRSGEVTTDLEYVSLVRDLECLIDPAECVERLWTGTRPVGSITFASGSGAKVADVNKVSLHTVNTVGGTTIVSDAPLKGAVARVFNRNDTAFQNQKFGGTQKIGKNPDGSFYDDIFESPVGLIATCTTPDSGVCIATEKQAGDYLVIVRFVDQVQHLIVYDGLPKGLKEFVNGVATKSFTIVKKLTNGNFQEYQAGSKTVVKPCGSTCP